MSFEEAYNDFKIYAQKRHKKQGFYTITSDFDKHILPYFINKGIRQISKVDIINWQNTILSKNFSNEFNRKLYYIFNSFMSFCFENDYIDCNYFKHVSHFPRKIEIKSHTVYTLRQFLKFRFCLSDIVIKHFFTFMYFYGTRPGEAMALKFNDLKFLKIRIIHTLRRKGDRGLDTPKNQSSVRVFKINLFMYFRFCFLKVYYKQKYGVFSKDYFIFGGPKPLAPTTIDRYKKTAYEKANLPSITQHEFRHSYITRKIHKKTPIDFVSRTVGHSKPSTTLDVYLHHEKNTLNVF